MPQGPPRVILPRPPAPAPDRRLLTTPYAVTNPTLSTLEDFLLAAIGLREGLSPESSDAAALGTAAGLFAAPVAMAVRAGKGARGGERRAGTAQGVSRLAA